jgi:hypothetical protein
MLPVLIILWLIPMDIVPPIIVEAAGAIEFANYDDRQHPS